MKNSHPLFIKLIQINLVFLFLSFNAKAQDIHFSQFNMSPLIQNPALTGGIYDLQANLNYREQWKSVANPFKTMAASLDMRLNKHRAKLGYFAGGIAFFNDKGGIANISTTNVSLNMAYHVITSIKSTLGAGLMTGYNQRTQSPASFQWGTQYDGTNYNAVLPSQEATLLNSKSFIDLGAGLLWRYDNSGTASRKITNDHDLKVNVGGSVYHINKPDYSFTNSGEKLHMKYVVHGDAFISFRSSSLSYMPSFLFYKQGPSQQFILGTLLHYTVVKNTNTNGINNGTAISFGAFYRVKDAFVPTILFEYTKYAIGLSYDINSSGLSTVSKGQGGFEISLRFVNPNPFMNHSGSRY